MGEQIFVSTGALPAAGTVSGLIVEAWERFRAGTEGECSGVYPALARADPDLFALCLASTAGALFEAGDAAHPFTLMSVSKPFVFALVCEAMGAEEARRRLGVEATGLSFDSAAALDVDEAGRTNPMVNAGALATTSFAPGRTPEERRAFVVEGLSRFAGRPLSLDEEVYASAMGSNGRNRGLAWILSAKGGLGMDPEEATELYTRQCSLSVSVRDLALMGATLADGGVHPLTRERVVEAQTCARVLAVMATAGLYERSGEWLYEVGVPGKSGIAGGLVAVAPGKGAIATFSPRLDAAGNSVKGQQATRFLARRLGLGLFFSMPA